MNTETLFFQNFELTEHAQRPSRLPSDLTLCLAEWGKNYLVTLYLKHPSIMRYERTYDVS